jgi:hypothetical protein
MGCEGMFVLGSCVTYDRIPALAPAWPPCFEAYVLRLQRAYTKLGGKSQSHRPWRPIAFPTTAGTRIKWADIIVVHLSYRHNGVLPS